MIPFEKQIYSRFSLKCTENSMTIDEVKSELELRGIDYSDCISKSDLVKKLKEARSQGKADPSIIKKFNSITDDSIPVDTLMNSDVMDDVVAKDGTLPGGLSPQLVRALSSDREIVTMLRDPKMQDIMSAVMTGGPKALQKVNKVF
jgi:hypothetical protein